MNNIYVDKLRKTCSGCFCKDCDSWCSLLKRYMDYTDERKRPQACPLKLITDRLAEERKKVVCDIKEKLVDGTSCEILPTGDICISLDKINNVLDKIERGTDD